MTDSPPQTKHVFYVCSHGSAGDHWFDWFAKALNAHPEIMIYMGDTIRAKYLKERSRKERADLFSFTKFLIDLGSMYTAIGECYAYRSYQLEKLWPKYGDKVRFINLTRHPYSWLGFYVDWRCSNMNMPQENIEGVEHEWSMVCHDEINKFNLRPYTRKDIPIWASYQGMLILNRMISDKRPRVKNVPIENIVDNPLILQQVVSYLTHDRLLFDSLLLEHIYSWVDTPFRNKGKIRDSPAQEYSEWPEWKKEAFQKIIKPNTLEMFKNYDYEL